jgi:hypothetical protein
MTVYFYINDWLSVLSQNNFLLALILEIVV